MYSRALHCPAANCFSVIASGRVVVLPSSSDPLSTCQYIAVAELLVGRDGRNDRVVLGAALTPAAIQAYLQDEIRVSVGPT
jgi:hypothetical protein